MPSIADALEELNDKAMTRKEQIKEYLRVIGSGDMENIPFDVGFECGVEWADIHPHWINVEDELPKINHNGGEWEFSDDVIVYLKDGDIAVGRYERDNSIGEHYWVLYGEDKDLIVTRWMPLPAPPKKGDQCND